MCTYFYQALKGEDDLGAVIRAHIHIESALNRFIEVVFESPKYLERLHLEFYEKVILAQAIGLKSQYAKALNSPGTLRNNFAHRLDTELGKNEVDSLYKSFDGDAKQIIQNGFKKTCKAMDIKAPKSITKLEPRQQLTLIVIAMQKMLEIVHKEVQDG